MLGGANRQSYPGMLRLVKGTVIGDHYCIEEALGKSAAGRGTFRALNLKLKIPVILKIFPRESEIDSGLCEVMNREQEILYSLNHPNIQRVFAVGQHGSAENPQTYIVLEFVDGRTLDEKLKSQEIEFETAVRYAIGILSALDYAHSKGIVHRNINPSSVMIARNGDVKLIGFGSAKSLQEGADTAGSLAIDGILAEDPYISPEAILAEGSWQAVTQQSDQYSLGLILYRMIAGKLPYSGDSPLAINSTKLVKEPVPIDSLKPVDFFLTDLVMRMISQDPEKRYSSTAEALSALSSYYGLKFLKKGTRRNAQ